MQDQTDLFYFLLKKFLLISIEGAKMFLFTIVHSVKCLFCIETLSDFLRICLSFVLSAGVAKRGEVCGCGNQQQGGAGGGNGVGSDRGRADRENTPGSGRHAGGSKEAPASCQSDNVTYLVRLRYFGVRFSLL